MASNGLTDRPTAELVLLILATFIGATFLLGGAGLLALRLWRPEVDISSTVASYTDAVSLVIGALVGYLAGAGQKGLISQRDNGTPGAGTPSA